MKAEKYQSKGLGALLRPVAENEHEMYHYALGDSFEGWCLFCGHTQDGVEPDAKRIKCEHCGEKFVYGFDDLLHRGLFTIAE